VKSTLIFVAWVVTAAATTIAVDPVVFASLVSGGVAIYLGRRKLNEIHVLVNSRLDDTEGRVEQLQKRVEELGGEKAPPTRKEVHDAT
jgi:hypothetical protein